MTLIDFKDIISEFFENHKNGVTFRFMDYNDFFNLNDVFYPACLVDVDGIVVYENSTEYNLVFFVLDLFDKHSRSNSLYDMTPISVPDQYNLDRYTNSNYLESLNETQMIASDLLIYLRRYSDILDIDLNNLKMDIIKDTFNDDEVVGVRFGLIFRTYTSINHCEIPLTSNPSVILLESGHPLLLEN